MDIAAAREEIGKAAGLLVNRFGHEADVFARLNAALQHLREDPPPRAARVATGTGDEAAESVLPVAEEAAATPSTESAGTAPAELATDHGPSTETTAPRRKRK